MRVLLDTNALIYLLDPRAPQQTKDRLQGLLQDVEKSGGQVIIPAPVLAEYLVNAGEADNDLFNALLQNRSVTVAAFDHLAALECATMQRTAKTLGNKRHPLPDGADWQKVKTDRQIVAIAKVRATRIVSDDGDVLAIAAAERFPACTVASLPLPSWAKQMHLVGVQPAPQRPVRFTRSRRSIDLDKKAPPAGSA